MLGFAELLLVGWFLACPLIGALIAPRKGVEPRDAALGCLLWGYIGLIYLATRPDVD